MELPSATVAKSILAGRPSESLLAKNRNYTHNQMSATIPITNSCFFADDSLSSSHVMLTGDYTHNQVNE
jgi:hypothetical protein